MLKASTILLDMKSNFQETSIPNLFLEEGCVINCIMLPR